MRANYKFFLFLLSLLLILPFSVNADPAVNTAIPSEQSQIPTDPTMSNSTSQSNQIPANTTTQTSDQLAATPAQINNSSQPSYYVRGIYVTQWTLENTKTITNLIKRAKEVGINTFVVDIERKSKLYEKNIALLKENNIHYIARLVVFPEGGYRAQIISKPYWAKRFQLAEYAASLGAETIQLDYIRYNTKQAKSAQNAKDILNVINYFRDNLNRDTNLQLALFGEVSFAPSMYIGQNIKEFYASINSIAPMVYPSHYYPYAYHSQRPYETIYDSLTALRKQFNNETPFKIYAYIEVFNVRYPMGAETKINYIYKELKAVQDSGANGWYAWSANNRYIPLFTALERYKKDLR